MAQPSRTRTASGRDRGSRAWLLFVSVNATVRSELSWPPPPEKTDSRFDGSKSRWRSARRESVRSRGQVVLFSWPNWHLHSSFPHYLIFFQQWHTVTVVCNLPSPTLKSTPNVSPHSQRCPSKLTCSFNHVWSRQGYVLSLPPRKVASTQQQSLTAGGKGLGKGGAKRHRKVLRDNIQ